MTTHIVSIHLKTSQIGSISLEQKLAPALVHYFPSVTEKATLFDLPTVDLSGDRDTEVFKFFKLEVIIYLQLDCLIQYQYKHTHIKIVQSTTVCKQFVKPSWYICKFHL